MKLVCWTRYCWDLTKLAPVYPAIDPQYRIRRAKAEDEKAVRSVVFSAFTLDSNWNFLLHELRAQLESALDSIFGEKQAKEKSDPLCLVITHGSRIIGACPLAASVDAENHLLTGPCVLSEYHNRGLATALLAQSLSLLREMRLTVAFGLTKQNSAAAQFVYPKFGSVSEPFQRHLSAI
ncbi:MAG: GNAT family N-acetyltransferase [Verrucomicrobiota bacterium]